MIYNFGCQSEGEKMANKKMFWLGILVMVLVFGMTVVGCATMVPPPNYYTLGDVSEENCSLIDLWPSGNAASGYTYYQFIKIDGQGDSTQWKPKSGGLGGIGGGAIVRVIPGSHTFTGTVIRGNLEMPASIEYDVVAGKGYTFSYDFEDGYVTFIIHESYEIDENGNFKRALYPKLNLAKVKFMRFNDELVPVTE